MRDEQEMLQARRYAVHDPALRGRIKCFWALRRLEPFSVDHILMPVGNIDVVYNFGAPVAYVFPDRETRVDGAHVLGVRTGPVRVVHTAPIIMVGVSFDDFAALPFLKRPLRCLAHRIIDAKPENFPGLPSFAPESDAPRRRLGCEETLEERLVSLESAWLRSADFSLAPSEEELRVLRAFRDKDDDERILDFCRRGGTHPKKLERMLYKFVGLSPKQYADVRRAQRLYAEIARAEGAELAFAANDFGYFDQSHMGRNVRKHFDASPAALRKKRLTAKSIIRIVDSDEM